MSPKAEPDDEWPNSPQDLPDPAADYPFVDAADSEWFSKYYSGERDLAGHLWATEREPIQSASRTPVIPRVVGGSAMMLVVVAAIVVSSGGNARRPVAALPTPAAMTMIFVPHNSALWSSTFLPKRAGRTDQRPIMARPAAAAGSTSSVTLASQVKDTVEVASSTLQMISERIDRQADAAPLPKSASDNLVDSLPTGNSIHLEIFYSSQNATAARSVAALLRSNVVGIDSLNIRAGDAKTSVIAYFFPSDRAGATAIAASLRQRVRQFVPVELRRRFPQPRPGTVEIFVPGSNAKESSNAG